MNTQNFKNVDGVWVAEDVGDLSYPTAGNDFCFDVEDKSFWFKYRNEVIFSFLSTHFGNSLFGKAFLDIGGGNGFVSKKAQDLGFDVVLLEPGSGAKNAVQRGIKCVYSCLIQDFTIDRKFDVIGLFDVVEHIKNPLHIIRSASDFLSPRGVIVLTVPAYMFLWSHDDELAGHFRRYSLNEVKRDIESLGLEVVWSSYFFSFLLIPIFLFRTLPYRLGKWLRLQPKTLAHSSSELVAPSVFEWVLGLIMGTEKQILKLFGKMPFGASVIIAVRTRSIEDDNNTEC